MIGHRVVSQVHLSPGFSLCPCSVNLLPQLQLHLRPVHSSPVFGMETWSHLSRSVRITCWTNRRDRTRIPVELWGYIVSAW